MSTPPRRVARVRGEEDEEGEERVREGRVLVARVDVAARVVVAARRGRRRRFRRNIMWG